MPAVMPSGSAQGPTCFERVRMGFMMGMCVGMASGAIFGGFGALRSALNYWQKKLFLLHPRFFAGTASGEGSSFLKSAR